MSEKWLPIPGWTGLYEVSDQGRVRSLDRVVVRRNGVGNFRTGKVIVPTLSNNGRLRVTLRKPGDCRYRLVHQLVLEAFRGPRPEGLVACHSDGNELNNELSNLRWDTQSSNMYDRVRHGTHHMANMTHCKHGHEFTTENTRICNGRYRVCKPCGRRRSREMRARAALRAAA